MRSYGRLRVKVKRLDPLDVLLFLLALEVKMYTDLNLHGSCRLCQVACT